MDMSCPQKNSAHNPQSCLFSRLPKTYLAYHKADETELLKSMGFRRQEAICVEGRHAYATEQ